MNRSLRAEEKGMVGEGATLQRARSLGAVIREKDEELALFLDMRKREWERTDRLLVDSPVELDPTPGSKPGSSPVFMIVPARKAAADDFLNSDSEKNDYDWLLTPPGTPLFPSLEKGSNLTGHNVTPRARATLLKSRLSDAPDALQKGNPTSKLPPASGANASTMAIRRPLSSGGPTSVSTKSSTTIASSRSSGGSGSISSKASSRPTTPTSHLVMPVASKSSRSSTPTARPSLPVKSTGPPRSGTASRPLTPTARPSLAPPIKTTSRGPTPPRQSSAPATLRNSGSSTQLSLAKPNNVAPKGSIAARSSSPTAKFIPAKPSELHGVSNGINLNSTSTIVPGRPVTASRGRSGPPSSRSLSAEPTPGSKIRRQSCSPSRGRASNGIIHGGTSIPAIVHSHVNNDDVNPVLIGSKMVERVINARRLVPPKQDGVRSSFGNAAGKTASLDSSGFGRTLSKKSLDMALRHMHIRQYPK